MSYDNKENLQDIIKSFIGNDESEINNFYNKNDKLIWDVSNRWYVSINSLSKGIYGLEDIHSELWMHVLNKLHTYDKSKNAKMSSWIYLICDSKAGMIVRSLKTKKSNISKNEIDYSCGKSSEEEGKKELLNFIGADLEIPNDIAYNDFLFDYIYLLLELIDSCTDKERKVYLLKIKGRTQNEIVDEANVSRSYIPKVFKRLSKKFKLLYDSLEEQSYINKEERNEIVKDLTNGKMKVDYISDKHCLDIDTINICREILYIAGII